MSRHDEKEASAIMTRSHLISNWYELSVVVQAARRWFVGKELSGLRKSFRDETILDFGALVGIDAPWREEPIVVGEYWIATRGTGVHARMAGKRAGLSRLLGQLVTDVEVVLRTLTLRVVLERDCHFDIEPTSSSDDKVDVAYWELCCLDGHTLMAGPGPQWSEEVRSPFRSLPRKLVSRRRRP